MSGMGNTAVIKPAEWTPMTATVLMDIIKEAGVPDGVVNLVHGFGPSSAGGAISEHPDVDAISFIGEPSTGSSIMKAGADTLKKLSYELGGKNPNIIFADADMDDVIETTINLALLTKGSLFVRFTYLCGKTCI